MDFKFVSHGLWSEEQNILLQHMHKKEFCILTNKCGNNLLNTKTRLSQEEPWPLVFVFKLIFTFNSQNPTFFYACVEEGYSAPLTIAHEKQT